MMMMMAGKGEGTRGVGGMPSNNGMGGSHNPTQHHRKRSRTYSLSGNNCTPPTNAYRHSRTTASGSGGNGHHNGGGDGGGGGGFVLDKDDRLLRLNVGGHPYDVVRTSIPLLETMMTDRWLVSGCLVDADGRVFIDRDGDAFGDILRYLRGGAEFLHELVRNGGVNGGGRGGGGGGNDDRLRRLRTEADYYGLHDLVQDIDVVTIGRRIVFDSNGGWGRVAGGCLPRNHRRRAAMLRREEEEEEGGGGGEERLNDDPRNVNGGDDDAAMVVGGIIDDDFVVQGAVDVLNDDDDTDEDEEHDDDDDENEDDNQNDEEEENDDPDEDNDDGEEEDDDDDHEEIDDDNQDDDEDDEEGEGRDDDDQPRPYKYWSWSKQYGNPEILRPHPTHTSSMIVGQDGSYLLLLRLAAALPSPLARIKWDQEEEEGRRVTRGGAARRRRGGRTSGNNEYGDANDVTDGGGGGGSVSRRGNELEEDYFVTVNIEAPLQAVMDAVDESQTHFPLLRMGLWDYRTEEEVTNEDPVFATFCAMDVVSLRAGDILSVSFMNDEISRERAPFPDNAPPDLVNSLTLVKVYGNTMARYERLKSSPNDIHSTLLENARGGDDRGPEGGGVGVVGYGGGGGNIPSSSKGKNTRGRNSRDHSFDESNDECAEDDSYQNQLDCEAEEFDRSLTRTARWISPRNDFPPTPFHPRLHSHSSSVIEFPHPGHYLLLGRVALGCRRDARFLSVLSGGPIEGHRAQLSVRSVGGRLLHAVGFVFESKPRLEWADLSILSENAMFNDVVHVPQEGSELSITTTGDCRLHPEGTEVGPFCSAVSQSLSCLLLDDEIMEVDRYMIGTVRNTSLGKREVKWFHTRSVSAPPGQGKGGTKSKPSLFDVDGHRLVWRGCLNNYQMNRYDNNGGSTVTVLVIGSLPPLQKGYILTLLKNNDPIAISITPESLDMKGRHCHYFQEIIELCDGDEIAVAQCAYGHEGDRSWREQLHVENRFVEFDTRIGHLSFVVLA
ncbi:hypothetical protein ACHAXA_005358 [Cyclostephanos tholiformis]|uniref:Potassium channel tetramerisation-type BTB domain-containing protein n=1 Tax=Cyclostephanos tholiformis TaxID=382380 RepID=A0ABD3RD37_9STRA